MASPAQTILMLFAGLTLTSCPTPHARANEPATFDCLDPTHHDGDAIRCKGDRRSMRLAGIDAPEMPGACRTGRICVAGDPYASRDHLAALTRNRHVTCSILDEDQYGRLIVSCKAGTLDLSCEQVRSGHAIFRYRPIRCAP